MANARWSSKDLLSNFNRVSIPVTDLHDGKDYQAGTEELKNIVNNAAGALWQMKAEVLPTAKSFSDPEYLKAGSWFFEDISNTEQKPDALAGHDVKYAKLLCEEGYSSKEKLKFVKQYLFYIDFTDNLQALTMRGILINGNGEVQGATQWKTGVDEAKEAQHAVTADNALQAAEATHATTADEAVRAQNATNADEATSAVSAGHANSAANLDQGAKINGLEVLTTKYASKIKGRNLVDLLGASSARDAFDKLRALGTNYDGLMLGDYIDIPQIVVSGIGTLNNDYNNLRVEIAGFDHYYKVGDTETGRGILFTFRNCAFTHGMNTSNVNAGGYNDANLKKIINGDFTAGLEAAIGTVKTVHRLVDTHGSWAWTAEKCGIPSEVETIGFQAWGRGGYYGGTSVQYPIYAIAPDHRLKTYNGNRQWYWEGTSSSGDSTGFCDVNDSGNANSDGAGSDHGVSPAFYL